MLAVGAVALLAVACDSSASGSGCYCWSSCETQCHVSRQAGRYHLSFCLCLSHTWAQARLTHSLNSEREGSQRKWNWEIDSRPFLPHTCESWRLCTKALLFKSVCQTLIFHSVHLYFLLSLQATGLICEIRSLATFLPCTKPNTVVLPTRIFAIHVTQNKTVPER